MCLRDAEPRRDLALLEIAEVAKAQRLPFTGVERAQAALDRETIIGGVEVVLRPGGIRCVRKRERRPCLFRTQCFGKFLLVELRRSCQLRRGRVSAQVGGELATRRAHADARLLITPWYPDCAAAIAQVPLDLPEDVRDRERGELDFSVGLETIDRLDEADRPDLHEILETFAAVRIRAGDRHDQRDVRLDQAFSSGEVPLLPIRAQQLR